MLIRTKYVYAVVFMALMLFACRSVRDYLYIPAGNIADEISLSGLHPSIFPLAHPELPSDRPFELAKPLVRLEELLITPAPRFHVAESFSLHEKSHVRVEDPRVFADSSRIYIDLIMLRAEPYSFPLPGAKLLSPFGGRRKNHAGVDLKTFAGDTVRAAFDGVVRMAREYSSYGNVVVIRHYNGLETVYSHNSGHLVKQGATVRAGQGVALVGRTGRATTDHLHFETRMNGRAFDPSLLFDLESRLLRSNILVCTLKNKRVEVISMQRFPPILASIN
ncbi:MAG: M23 family metallopeptidase [Tannerellaceae bacterium]|nr:M23 family metallopeptidase [Tannerellaceae bacterium]